MTSSRQSSRAAPSYTEDDTRDWSDRAWAGGIDAYYADRPDRPRDEVAIDAVDDSVAGLVAAAGAGRADQCCAHATCSMRPGHWGGLVTQPCESAHAHGAFVGKMAAAQQSSHSRRRQSWRLLFLSYA